MKTVLSLAVLLLACLAGTQGAVKNAGDVCDPDNDTCTGTGGTEMVCDATALKCLSKVNETCTDATTCVTGATCDGSPNQCTCDAGYTDYTDDKLCTVADEKPGGDCGASDDACDTGATCNGQTKCACDDGHTLNTATAVCGIDDGKVGGTCTADNNCGNGAKCPASNDPKVCECDAGFTGVPGGDDCNVDAGGSCAGDLTCVSGSTCQSEICKVDAGGSCADNLATACVSGSTCQGDVCKVDAGGSCADNLATECVSGSTCQTDVCNVEVGEDCSDSKISCVTGASCDTDTKCACDDGYTDSDPVGTCSEENGAVGVVSSFLTVTLAAVFTSLFTRH